MRFAAGSTDFRSLDINGHSKKRCLKDDSRGFCFDICRKIEAHRIGVASQQPKNLRPMITSLDWLAELPHHFRPAKLYMYYIWHDQVFDGLKSTTLYNQMLCTFHVVFRSCSPHIFRELRFEASAFFAFLVAFYVMEDWDHHPPELSLSMMVPLKIILKMVWISMINGKTNGLR